MGYGPGDLKRMGVRQDVLKFSNPTAGGASSAAASRAGERNDYFGADGDGSEGDDEEGKRDPMIEITPPELISALITENGIMTPNAVSEELIKLWF